PDVPAALTRWQAQGRTVCIFSSGSVAAQKLLFANSVEGDLTPHIMRYFDTTTGPKTSLESYRKIASALQRTPAQVAFISDAVAELDAAKSAGMQTLLSLRPGNRPQPANDHISITSFDPVLP